MKRAGIRIAVALVGLMAVLAGATEFARAAPPTSAMTDRGAYVILGKPPSRTGGVEFDFGWHNSAQFATKPLGFWIGVYDKTNSHYVWATDRMLPALPPEVPGSLQTEAVDMHYSDPTANLPPGDYLVNFFVRGSYSPASNVAEISLEFTVPEPR
jgi:hypothetical protein